VGSLTFLELESPAYQNNHLQLPIRRSPTRILVPRSQSLPVLPIHPPQTPRCPQVDVARLAYGGGEQSLPYAA
jgi:hypothetical protein